MSRISVLGNSICVVTVPYRSIKRATEANSDHRFDPVQHELDFCIRHLDNYLRIPPSTWTLDRKCAVDVWRVSVFGVFARMAYFMSTFQTDNSVAAFMTSQSRYFTYTGRHAQKLAEVTSTNHMDRVHQTEHSAVSKLSALVERLQAEMTASHHTDVPFYKLGLLITYLEKSWSYNLDTVRRKLVSPFTQLFPCSHVLMHTQQCEAARRIHRKALSACRRQEERSSTQSPVHAYTGPIFTCDSKHSPRWRPLFFCDVGAPNAHSSRPRLAGALQLQFGHRFVSRRFYTDSRPSESGHRCLAHFNCLLVTRRFVLDRARRRLGPLVPLRWRPIGSVQRGNEMRVPTLAIVLLLPS